MADARGPAQFGLSRERLFLLILLLLLSVLTATDLVQDYHEGGSSLHILLEGIALLCYAVVFVWIVAQWLQGQALNARLQSDLNLTHADLQRWKQEAQGYLQGLGRAIDEQFERWKFTPAEKDIAQLMLKGLSFKEIAEIRQTSERTVRQQSLEIYRKSGLAGRAELSAFFLEDLFAPAPSGAQKTSPSS